MHHESPPNEMKKTDEERQKANYNDRQYPSRGTYSVFIRSGFHAAIRQLHPYVPEWLCRVMSGAAIIFFRLHRFRRRFDDG